MASPPFNINQSLPGDSDIVSQHPPNARTFRDIVESWLLINHDTNGNHARVDIPRSASPASPASGVDVLFVSTTGRLKIKHSNGTEEFVGTAPGTVAWHVANVAPSGWLYANGAILLASDYPDLFAVLGSNYGGNGITNFALPDLRGRSVFGVDDGTNRLSLTKLSLLSIGGVGGAEFIALTPTQIPGGVPVSITSISTTDTVSGSITGSSTGQTASGSITGSASGGTVSGTPTGSVSGSASVTSGASVLKDGVGAQSLGSGTTGFGWSNSPTVGTLNSSGSISASFAGTGFSGGSLTSPATVSGSFSGTVSTGAVSGSFSGSGTGTGTGSGATTGANPGGSFSILPPAIVLYPIVKT